MKKYFRIIGILELISFVFGTVVLFIWFFSQLEGLAKVEGGGIVIPIYIILILLYLLVGPALGLLFIHVGTESDTIYLSKPIYNRSASSSPISNYKPIKESSVVDKISYEKMLVLPDGYKYISDNVTLKKGDTIRVVQSYFCKYSKERVPCNKDFLVIKVNDDLVDIQADNGTKIFLSKVEIKNIVKKTM